MNKVVGLHIQVHCVLSSMLIGTGESQVSEDAMARSAQIMEERGISHEDQGSILVDFTKQVPGKEGKRLGKTVLR
jgi:arginyl-tRNA synthetase